ncbi:hypothetical protein RB653_007895 [Dictyostelium firmibasis]|uniref:Uncharacterized protein n=1 Tax=Dictyostelium firmibasis TaxID=79012 RepID=A0AAN7YPF4_9MYCE
MYSINNRSCICGDVNSILQNDTFRILSCYDSERDQKIGYDDALSFFQDSGTLDPQRDIYNLFGEDYSKVLTYNQIYKYLFDQLKRNIFILHRDFLLFLKDNENKVEDIVSFKDLEDYVKGKQVRAHVNPRIASLNLILEINGNDDSFKCSIEKIRVYITRKLSEYDLKVKGDMEKEITKEVNNKNIEMIGNPVQ